MKSKVQTWSRHVSNLTAGILTEDEAADSLEASPRRTYPNDMLRQGSRHEERVEQLSKRSAAQSRTAW